MTYEEAVATYNEMSVAKPSDYLFDGKRNIQGRLDAVYAAFGIVTKDRESICGQCVHGADCPLSTDEDEDYEDCNFYEEE